MENQQTDDSEQLPAKKNRLAHVALLAIFVAVPASAHDFWVQPSRFWLAPNVPTAVSIFVGHGPDRQLWDADIKRVTRVISIGPNGQADQTGSVKQGGTGTLSFKDEGFHLVALETNHALSELPALRFNDYLRAEGLTGAIAFRKKNGQTTMPGSEIYSRRAKVLMRVGKPTAARANHVTKPMGLTLEIVPEQNPFSVAANAPLPFRIYYEGRPLGGATVMLNDLGADAKPVAVNISDMAGRVAFPVPRRGQWQVNVIWTKPLPKGAQAQFDTTFSSLTFGFDAHALAK